MSTEAHRWIVVADSEFLPARDGGEREQQGLVEATLAANALRALVIPAKQELDLRAYRELVGDICVLPVHRRRSPLMLLHPRHPFVVASRPTPPGLANRLRSLVPDATGIFVLSYKSHGIGDRLARDLGLPMVVRQHNRESDYHRSLVEGSHGPRRLVMRWESARIARDEARHDRSDLVTAFADIAAEDAQRRRAAGARQVMHVPPFVFGRGGADRAGALPRQAGRGDRPRVVFLGALDVVTNLVGLDWFVDRVWPQVRAAVPDAVFDVVGARPSAALRERLGTVPGSEIQADVPSVEPYLERAWVTVNPAVAGSGVNIKLVEYLQAGRPTVSTSLATRGLDLRSGIDLEVHDDPGAFAQAVIRLLADRESAAAMAANGRATIRRLTDPTRNIAMITRAFEQARSPRMSEEHDYQ